MNSRTSRMAFLPKSDHSYPPTPREVGGYSEFVKAVKSDDYGAGVAASTPLNSTATENAPEAAVSFAVSPSIQM